MQAACKSCKAFLCEASVEFDIAAGMNFHSVKVIRTSEPECEAELGTNRGEKNPHSQRADKLDQRAPTGPNMDCVTEYLHLFQSPRTQSCSNTDLEVWITMWVLLQTPSNQNASFVAFSSCLSIC